MSGGRFLVSLKDVLCSEKIIKIQSLVQEGFDIDEYVKVTQEQNDDDFNRLLQSVQSVVKDADSIRLNDDSRDISNHVAGYVAHKLVDFCR